MPKFFSNLFLTFSKFNFLALVTIAISVIVIGNLAWLLPTLNAVRNNALTLHKTIATNAQNQITSFISIEQQNLQNAIDVINNKTTSTDQVLARLMKENQAFQSIVLIDDSNKEVKRLERLPTKIKPELKDRSNDPLTSVIDQNKTYLSPVTINPANLAIITLALPVNQESGFKALVIEFDMKFFSNIVRAIPVGKVGVVYIVDQNGYVIAHPESTVVLNRTNYKNRKIIQDVLKGKDVNTLTRGEEYKNDQNLAMFAVALPIKQLGWGVVVENPQKDALAALNQIFEVGLISFSLEAILIILLIWNYFNLIKTSNVTAAERDKMLVVLQSISDAVIAVDLNKNVVIFNRAASNLTGYLDSEVLSKPISQVLKVFEGDKELSVQDYTQHRADGFEGITFNKRNLKLVAKNDKQSQVNIITSQISEGVSTNLGSILTLHDVTEEIQLEKMKVDFVSIAAHELRTPLTIIQGYLQVFLSESRDKFSQEQKLFLDRINITTRRLGELIENLLNVSQIERHSLTFRPEMIDWVKNVELIVGDFQNHASQKHISLNFIKPLTPIPEIYADKLRINEALSNLIGNALNYTRVGGSVKIWVELTESEVITHIRDSGQGIPAEALPHLFTKFFRVQGAFERGSKGTGLGLYISKAIVNMHHGRIWVNSEIGVGSTFSFTIPLHIPITSNHSLTQTVNQVPI